MLSENHIIKLIEEYSKTKTGKAEIAKKKKGKFIAKIASETEGNGCSSKADVIKVAEDMRKILFSHISKSISSFKLEDIIIMNVAETESGYSLSIGFDDESLSRKSLDPESYPDGITNIIKLFVTGYNARGAVRGVWEGHGDDEVWSLRHREPSEFMNNAVTEFNQKYKNIARAELFDEYKN